ncbi:GyrI-like domain-containing protein [Danxiaibacter flavus]|uniref:GyrI-like domain-containing protein n=1 Tax=Danxiaibacter flavus TaxID=3049108 RepID=A0ABV3ZGX1_9BACT|nr:GyrI-like domain-containing protein [Chitinophagaceae bacterium DXS]
MEKRTLPAMQVLYFTTKTTLGTMHEFVIKVPGELYKEAMRLNLFIGGPQYWIYYGADGKPDTEFTLEIALPVNGKASGTGKFQIKTLPSLNYVSSIHHGEWKELGTTYEKVIGSVYANQMSMLPTKECREMYLNIDTENPANNITEVLIGVE